MLRLEFSAADLARVRVASAPHPSWELILAINSLQVPDLPPRYWSWRRAVEHTRRTDHGHGRVLMAAAALVPASGNFPDFFTPPIGDRDVGRHLDTILSAPRNQLREDLSRTARTRPAVPRWARDLYRNGRSEGIVEVLRAAYPLLVEPVDRLATQHVEAGRARYARLLLEGGTDHLLANLHPAIRWRSPVLEGDYPVDRTIDLAGRGLVVTPAYFCWGAPVTFIDADQPPMLVVPHEATEQPGSISTGHVEDRLGKLFGSTRARLLAELSIAGSTGELAARLNVTQAAVSQHTKVLREARLIVTARAGMSVRHSLSPLGRDLLQD
jgi:DNA-binding transcriptional ArsR family regulator